MTLHVHSKSIQGASRKVQEIVLSQEKGIRYLLERAQNEQINIYKLMPKDGMIDDKNKELIKTIPISYLNTYFADESEPAVGSTINDSELETILTGVQKQLSA
jgi:UDP-N-acetyl-D-mannosaminuronic acid transferase (WecB/TagA/CpsF family)